MTVSDAGGTGVTEAAGRLGLELRCQGDGPPLLFLHGASGLLFSDGLIDRLSADFTVFAPSHPGWGQSVRRPGERTVDDIAYRYLDLIDAFEQPPLLVGCSLGAWLALEIATKNETGIAGLALVSPLGIRTGEPTRRYYLDRYAVSAEQLTAALYGPDASAPDLAGCSDDDLLLLARAQEAATFFGWQPYLHNPALLDRLHRITRPILVVTGAQDGFVLADDHVATLTGALGGDVETAELAGAGHQVEEQQPDQLAELIVTFARKHAPVRR